MTRPQPGDRAASLLVSMLEDTGLSTKHIAAVITVLGKVCNRCYDDLAEQCTCAKDE